MRFLATEIPKEWDSKEWIYDLFEDRGKNKAYIVNAEDEDEARRLVFNEKYKEIKDAGDVYGIAQCEIEALSEDENDEFIMHAYGEHDGKIILDIINDYIAWQENEDDQNDYPEKDKRIYNLADETIKELCYARLYMDIGLIKIEKELGKKK